jgi:hypothetical protein
VHAAPQDGWQDYLVRLAHGVRRVALAHPLIFPLVATQPAQAPWVQPPLRNLGLIDSFLEGLKAAGFSDQGAVAAYRAFSSFLLGHLLLEVAAMGAAIGGVDEVSDASSESDLGEYPQLLRLKGLLSEDRTGEEFEEALENLMNRIELMR